MKIVKKGLESIFPYLTWALSPVWMQKTLRYTGIKLPARFAKQLGYQGKINFTVNDTDISIISYSTPVDLFIFWYGIFGLWEKTQLRLWSQEVLSRRVILDIGANSGVYSIIAATNNKAHIYAFEPVPVVRNMFKSNVEINSFLTDRIDIYDMLVGDTVGQQTLYIPHDGWVDVSSIDKNFANSFARPGEFKELLCQMTTVDNLLKDVSISQGESILIKIDVEGAEYQVLQGMKQSFEKYNISFTAELLTEDYFNKCIKEIPSDFACYAIDEKKDSVYKTSKFVITASNYFFTKEKRLDTLL